MSQAELSRRAKVPHTTLNSMISRGSRSSPHLLSIARALGTSAAYLTGETDDPSADVPDDFLTAEQRGWVNALDKLDRRARNTVLDLVDLLENCSGAPRGATIHERQSEFRRAG